LVYVLISAKFNPNNNNNNNTISKNKPDIIIRDNEKGICVLINVAISGVRNVIKKEAQKILKYKDRTIEIHRLSNVKIKATSVLTGATGTISKSFRKYLSNITEKHESRNYRQQPYRALHA
jgi:hypothetical protein